MADSWTEEGWRLDGLGHNGPKAQLKEFKRQLRWLEGGYLEQLKREKRDATKKARELKKKIRRLEAK